MKKITLISSKKKFGYTIFLKKNYLAFSILFLLFSASLFSQSYTTNGPHILKDCIPWEGRGTNAMHVFGGGPGECKTSMGMDMVREWIDMKMTSIAKMRQMADEAKANDQVIILQAGWYDHADFGGGTPYPHCQLLGANPRQDGRYNAIMQRWRDIANEFRNDSHVWLGLWNEPYAWDGTYGYSDQLWHDDAIAMINDVRSTGAQNIILLAGSHMGQGYWCLTSHAPSVLVGQKNIVFDVHCYDNKWNTTQAVVESRFKAIFDAGVPLIVGEFGAGEDYLYDILIGACTNRRVSGLAWLWGQFNSNFHPKMMNYGKGQRLSPYPNTGCNTSGCTPPTITAVSNTNNAGWVQKDAAVLCAGGTAAFGPWPVVANGWTWTGPNNFSSSAREITFTNAQANQSGTYTATYDNGTACPATKNFYLTVNALPTVTANANVNNTGWVQKDAVIMCQGGTVAFGPHPWQDPNGWTWTGPNGYTAAVREITFNNAQTNLTGIYTAKYTDANGCSATKAHNLNVDVCTGINALSENNAINIYPNPFNLNFHINVSSTMILKNTEMRIYDVCGKQVRTISITDHETVIDRAELQSGLYFYSIINDNEKIANGKIVVQE